MRLRRELRNPRAVAPIVAVLLAVIWASCAGAVPCPERVFLRVGDKFVAIGWTMGQDEHEIDDFGGYQLWMREIWKNPVVDTLNPSESFSLVREYVLGEDDPDAAGYWPFDEYWAQPTRSDSTGPDTFQVLNTFPYEFAVTTFSASDPLAVNAVCFAVTVTDTIHPRVGTRGDLSDVRCIPNPYRASADWEYDGQRRVAFIGLPETAKIRIYTVAADHVVTLEHGDMPGGADSDIAFWDLTNETGDEVAPGVYIFQVESEGLGSMTGKVMIIK